MSSRSIFWYFAWFLLVIGQARPSQKSGEEEAEEKIIKMKRLPPQVLYAGETTIIDLSNFFTSESQLTYFVYCLDDSEEMNGAQIHCPYWLDFDHKIPRFIASPPKNLTWIEPAYTVRVIAKITHTLDLLEEELVLIVQHTCFEKCPKHFGVGCTDWELMLTAAGVYGLVMFMIGIFCHHSLHFCAESYQRQKAQRPMRKRNKRVSNISVGNDNGNEYSDSEIENMEAKTLVQKHINGEVDESVLLRKHGIVTVGGQRVSLKSYFDYDSDDEKDYEMKLNRMCFLQRWVTRFCRWWIGRKRRY